jgi:HD-GYP domain-containing protein (c-di-GMP phosphodiesterase class II)
MPGAEARLIPPGCRSNKVYNRTQEVGNVNRSGASPKPVPHTLEQDQVRENLTVHPTPQTGLDRQPAFLGLIHRANQLAYAASQDELLRQALGLILEAAQAESAIYFHLDSQTDELVVAAVAGDEQSQHLVGLRFKRQEGLLDAILSGSQAAVVGDLPGDPAWLRAAQPGMASRMHNVIGLSLETQGRALGVAQLYNFKDPDLDLVQALCDRLAMEIDRWQVLEHERQSNRRLRSLIDTIGQVAGTLDRNQLLRLVTEHASRLVGAERSTVFLVDPNTKEMMFQVAYQVPEQKGLQNVSESSAHDREAPRSRPGARSGGAFNYYSGSAITVPIITGPRSQARGDSAPLTLGGLMAINKAGASFEPEDMQTLEILADQTSTFLQVAELYESAGELMLDAIEALVAAIDAKDPYTQGHSQRVSDYSVMIAQELGLSESQVYEVRVGSLFHDVGKIGIPDAILQKQGKLTEEEYAEVKKHCQTGKNILGQVKMLEPMLPAVLEHHERLNGSGYPFGLQDQQISQMGRIVAVADVFDAMTSNRPYRKALAISEVLEYLQAQAGILFDESCVEALERIIQRANSVG